MILFRLANNITTNRKVAQPPGNLYAESVQYGSRNIERNREGTINTWFTNEDYINNGRVDDDDESFEEIPRKRVRVRVPVVRSRTARQHKFTVVRRRPLTSRTKDLAYVTSTTHAPRRIVVTRVRTLGSVDSIYSTDTPADYGNYQPTGFGKHKVTITRRRKLQPTPTPTKNKVRVTRKKLVAVRPILPTSTFAIITTGFFTAPSSAYDEYSEEHEEEHESEIVRGKDHSAVTPSLEETPNLIDNKPDEEASIVSLDASSTKSEEGTSNTAVIITDNFFFPASDDEGDEEYEDDYNDTTTTTENVNKITVLMKDEHPRISHKDEDNIVSNKSDVENDNITVTTTPISQTTLTNLPEEQTIKTPQESDNASINITESIALKDINNTKLSTKTIVNEEVPTTELTRIKEDGDDKLAAKEQTSTTATPEEQTTFMEDTTKLNVFDESTSIPDKENITTEGKGQETTSAPEESTERSAIPETINENPEEILTVRPIQPDVITDSNSTQISLIGTVLPSDIAIAPSFESVIPLETTKSPTRDTDSSTYLDDSYVPSVIPLGANYTRETKSSSVTAISAPATKVTSEIASPTPEEIEAGLADDLYLSLSRLDFPEILPSKSDTVDLETKFTPDLALEPSTSVYYTETVVTSTRLRTYTYVVTQLNGLETKVTSSTTVRPRVTTLTLTVPVTVTVTPTVESSAGFVSSVYNPVPVAGEYEAKDEEEGRRFNLATRVMSNGVEVIVAGPTPALRWENSNPQPTLTL
ncbi:PREDICTED: FK506-binding protein 5-like [Vollenhovia emeryi]|uniref:FK506-binding protein 5-like n=1 Tax=Vollenhovia emeryi TaxID=411798 RepID=UPI0005F4DA60|nr:PREDICTED: FK506-binding protein 5-like [Vollenhovia emeryi]